MDTSAGQIKGRGMTAECPSMTPKKPSEMPSSSAVAQAYNEEQVLEKFHRRVTAPPFELGCAYESVLVNDSSHGNTLSLMHALRAQDSRVSVVDLSPKFGKEIALTAGLDHTKEELATNPVMLEVWGEGYDIADGMRTARDDETWFKMTTQKYFYGLIKGVSRVDILKETGDCSLMTRRAVGALGRLREEHRFMKGLFAWIDFPFKPLTYRRDERATGEPKWNYKNPWNFALEGITSFTVAPQNVATYRGLSVASLSLLYVVFVIWKELMFSDPMCGYPSLTAGVLFLGTVQLVLIASLGNYVGCSFNEVKCQPLYSVNRLHGSERAENNIISQKDLQ